MINSLKIAFNLLITLMIVTGIIYPVIVTGFAQLFFSWKANGSLIERDNKIVGSVLIGQSFTAPHYFWGRPSATTPFPYNAENSSGSNLGPSNPDFLAAVKERVATLQANDPQHRLVPVDLVTASGSGLDPDISPSDALYQVPRIAQSRHISEADLQLLIERFTQARPFYVLGEPRVNVLLLNLALDNYSRNLNAATQS